MNELLQAINNLPIRKEKKFTVRIQGEVIEVDLQMSLEVRKHGEDAFILHEGKIVRKPKPNSKIKSKILKQDKTGLHFYDGDPFWAEKITEKGYTWQTESK